jgi:hypothetical protein
MVRRLCRPGKPYDARGKLCDARGKTWTAAAWRGHGPPPASARDLAYGSQLDEGSTSQLAEGSQVDEGSASQLAEGP